MINKSMFFTESNLKDYRDMSLDAILREYLLCKGTFDSDGKPTHETVTPKMLIDSGLFVYGLKSNATNKKAVEYYCERDAQRRNLMSGGVINIPKDLWDECNKKNMDFCKRNVL